MAMFLGVIAIIAIIVVTIILPLLVFLYASFALVKAYDSYVSSKSKEDIVKSVAFFILALGSTWFLHSNVSKGLYNRATKVTYLVKADKDTFWPELYGGKIIDIIVYRTDESDWNSCHVRALTLNVEDNNASYHCVVIGLAKDIIPYFEE